jgi:hypothetical protein
VVPLTEPDPSTGSCGLASPPTEQVIHLEEPVDPAGFLGIMAAKMLGGLAIGGGLGLLAGIILSFIEAAEAEGEPYDVVIPAPTLTPATTDAVNVDGKVVHPKGLRPPEVDAGRAEEWRSEDNLIIDSRR